MELRFTALFIAAAAATTRDAAGLHEQEEIDRQTDS